MRPQTSGFGFGGGFSGMPPLTRALLVAFVGMSLANVVLGPHWLGIIDLHGWMALSPQRILRGEIWRLATWPWLAESVFGLVIGGLILYLFASRLEVMWGRERFLRRVIILLLVPAVATVLLSLFVPSLRVLRFTGVSTLTTALLTAFASQLRSRQIMLFPLPIPLSGDTILILVGALMGLSILFGGSVIPHVPSVLSFGLALAWFRFDMGRDLRRWWLQQRKRRLEARLAKLRKQRGLRVVSSDDDDENPSRRYLN